jgi:hypothetical protein
VRRFAEDAMRRKTPRSRKSDERTCGKRPMESRSFIEKHLFRALPKPDLEASEQNLFSQAESLRGKFRLHVLARRTLRSLSLIPCHPAGLRLQMAGGDASGSTEAHRVTVSNSNVNMVRILSQCDADFLQPRKESCCLACVKQQVENCATEPFAIHMRFNEGHVFADDVDLIRVGMSEPCECPARLCALETRGENET